MGGFLHICILFTHVKPVQVYVLALVNLRDSNKVIKLISTVVNFFVRADVNFNWPLRA